MWIYDRALRCTVHIHVALAMVFAAAIDNSRSRASDTLFTRFPYPNGRERDIEMSGRHIAKKALRLHETDRRYPS